MELSVLVLLLACRDQPASQFHRREPREEPAGRILKRVLIPTGEQRCSISQRGGAVAQFMYRR